MGSSTALDVNPDLTSSAINGHLPSGMTYNTRGKQKAIPSDFHKRNTDKVSGNEPKEKKRKMPGSSKPAGSRNMPKRAAASSNMKEQSDSFSEKSDVIETKRDPLVEDETVAVNMTSGPDDPRPNRRLTDFILHDADGNPQPFEMSEVDDLFISGTVLHWEGTPDKDKDKGVRCEGFGRIETWAISGYEEGSPVIWVSTDVADYDCVKPASNYRKFYDHFLWKARCCIQVFQKLSKSSGGNPDLSFDELIAGVVRSMSGSKSFPNGTSIKDFVISQGEFIYNQLIGLEESQKDDTKFSDLPVLLALRDESRKKGDFLPSYAPSDGSLKIRDESAKLDESVTSSGVGDEDEDAKLARLLQEEEYWTSMKSKKGHRPATGSNKYYIKINENEIANDYPLPAYYKTSAEEMDEYVVLDNDIDVYDSDSLPRMMLHNWSLYNSDSRLISLELLPMKPCAEVDVTAYGSGIMTADDGSGFCLDTDPKESSSSVSGAQHAGGIPIYLSAIKEWMIEFGSSMVFISIRTDLAWYRLGKPSKQYAPWYETVLKTARLSIGIITLLKEQSRVARLSFADVVKKLLEFKKDHPAYISSNPAVLERYVVVHGQIILQQFAEYPDEQIKKCAFVTGLSIKMEERQHTKLEVKKKAVIKQETNLNPRAAMGPLVSKRKAMEATTTRLINRIWGEYYSNYSPDDMNVDNIDPKEEEVDEEQEENEEDDDEEVEEEKVSVPEKVTPKAPSFSQTKCKSNIKQIEWDGGPVGTTCSSEPLYRQAVIRGEVIAVASAVFLEVDDSEEMLPIYFVEYMFETSDARKMIHGRLLKRGSQTVLGNTANEREVFLTNECMEFELGDVKKSVVLDVRKISWGHQHRKDDINFEKNDRARAEDRKRRDLPMEYYCKSLYWPERGAFFKLPYENMGLGTGVCHSCKIKETERENEIFVVNSSKSTITYKGLQYKIHDFVYVSPHHFGNNAEDQGTFKGGRNVGLKAYVVCQLLGFDVPSISKKPDPKSAKVKVRRFFRPEDASLEKAYSSDIREVYYSEQKLTLPVEVIEGRCEVRRKIDVPPSHGLAIFEHIFFCEHLYEPDTGAVKRLPTSIRLDSSKVDESTSRKRKGKGKEGESDPGVLDKQVDASQKSCLATLDIFAGCGGLSEGLEKSGVSETKWAIEYEEPAGEAFRLNHPEALTLINNCNVILRAIMERCGDADECISTSEAAELSKQLGDEINNLPLPGQVDFINGGPPCQGFSGMNRFNQSTWSKVQCEMILAFLSFADYFRPRFFLLENVRNFVSFNKGQTFRLTLASLLEIGYQVRFGILEAGAYGVAQSRKRAFIWAASPEETLPEWPEPMHVFAGPELKISLTGNSQFAAVRSTGNGAPFRAITVKDTIGDLPSVGNGASKAMMDYGGEPVSWFQKKIRGDMTILHDHISKEMNELNLIRCQRIPRRPGSDWRDLPEEKVRLSTGQLVDLIPWCLPNTAKRHNQWKGLFGRLDWEGNFPTSITDPQPMGKVGMCFHPEQDRIVTVRECARSQGFPDGYKFAGTIQHKHRQIGNAVPPPLAFAMGRKLKEVLNKEEM